MEKHLKFCSYFHQRLATNTWKSDICHWVFNQQKFVLSENLRMYTENWITSFYQEMASMLVTFGSKSDKRSN